MNPRKQLTGACEHCRGPLAFSVELIGTMARCPHCGRQTELVLGLPEPEPASSRRTILWVVIGVFVLVVGLGLPLWGLRWAGQHRQQLGPRTAPGLEVSALTVERSSDGSMVQVAGTIGNHSETRRAGIRVEFNVLDAEGRQVATGAFFQPLLEPGAQARFKVPVDAPQAASARLVSAKDGQVAQP